MKTLLTIFAFSFLLPMGILAQDMQPPPPIDNEFFTNSIGNWVSDEYDMMGSKWVDESNVSWALGNQFLVITAKSKTANGMTFESIGYMSMDKDKNIKMWYFDTWGMEGASEFTGKLNGNTCTIEGGNKFMKGKGTMTLESNTLTQAWSFTMPGPDGKDVSQDMKVVYKKK